MDFTYPWEYSEQFKRGRFNKWKQNNHATSQTINQTLWSPLKISCFSPKGSRIVFQSFAFRSFFLPFRECKLTPDAQRRPTVDMKGIPQEFRWFDVIMEAWGPFFDGLIFMGHWGCFTPNKLFIKLRFGSSPWTWDSPRQVSTNSSWPKTRWW